MLRAMTAIDANGITIEYESRGDGEPLLLGLRSCSGGKLARFAPANIPADERIADQRKRDESSGDLRKVVELALGDAETLARVVADTGEAEIVMTLPDTKQHRETAEGRASALAEAIIVDGDPAAADRRLARIAAVTPADIQRVARRWLRDEASAAVRYLPEESQQGAREDRIATAATVATAALSAPGEIGIVQPAPESERVAPPPPGPEIIPPVPTPDVQRLANGLNVVTVRNPALPLVTAALVAGGGAAADPEGRAGLAELAAAVMPEGTTTRSAAEIDAAVEALGGSLASNADWDGSSLGITVQTGQVDAALAILADVARNARLAEEELERQRAIAIDAFTVALSDPGDVSGMAAMRALYGQSAYGHPEGGTPTSLRAIGRADIEAAYRATWVPGNATLILSGDIDPARARALAEQHFGSWAGPAVATRSAPTVRT